MARTFLRMNSSAMRNTETGIAHCRAIEQMFVKYFARRDEALDLCANGLTEAVSTPGLCCVKYKPTCSRPITLSNERDRNSELCIKDLGIQYKVVRDPDASVTRLYEVAATPTIIFLNRNGAVRYFGNELPGDYPSGLAALIEQKS